MNWDSITVSWKINVNEIEMAVSENIKTVYDEQAPAVCKKFTKKIDTGKYLNKEINRLCKLKKVTK